MFKNIFRRRRNLAGPFDGIFENVADAVHHGAILTVVDATATQRGDATYMSGAKIDGTHEGSICVGSGVDGGAVCWISRTGTVKGNITAGSVYIEGKVEGVVRAKRVVIDGQGRLNGAVVTEQLIVRNPTLATVNSRLMSQAVERELAVRREAQNKAAVEAETADSHLSVVATGGRQ